MKKELRIAYDTELGKAVKFYKSHKWDASFRHLERAHILGQSFVVPHTRSHLWMLKIGLKKRDLREVAGQLARIGASILFTKIWVPLGNTGGANVNPMKPMPVPDDLKKILEKTS